jgi:hypothetical protein
LTPRSKGYFMRISTVVFVLKGGKYSLRYLYRKELSEKYEIYRIKDFRPLGIEIELLIVILLLLCIK